MQTFGYILLSILILLVMVLIHELGHYTTAKILGFTIDEFAVGFGPKILSRRRKNGELFSLRLLPLGGFCAFYGETDDEAENNKPKDNNSDAVNESVAAPISSEKAADTSKTLDDYPVDAVGDGQASSESVQNSDEDLLSYVMRTKPKEEAEKTEDKVPVRLDKFGNPAKTFNQQKPWKRIIVLFGGVLFNFLSAIVFSLIYLWAVGYAVPKVTYVYPVYGGDGVATYCDLIEGDLITAVNGEYISVMKSYDEIMEKYSKLNEGDSLVYTVIREGKQVDVKVVKQTIKYTEKNKDGTEEEKTYVGFGFGSQKNTAFIGNNAKNAFTYCVPYTFKLSWAILGSFGDLFTGKAAITDMSGPIGSITTMAKLSALDWRNILILLPLLASNLAIFNIMPFPALDGSRVVFTVIEWIRKKPINRKVEGMIHAIGMVALLLFVVAVDILFFAL